MSRVLIGKGDFVKQISNKNTDDEKNVLLQLFNSL